MKVTSWVAAAMLIAPAPAISQVDVGRGDWNAFPQLASEPIRFPTPSAVKFVETVLREKRCELPGESHHQFDFEVPYAVLVKPDGMADRVIVADIGCPPLESLVGSMVLQLSSQGVFHPTGESHARWYSSAFSFNLQ